MPELPEVETVVRELRSAKLAGLRILDVKVYWPKVVAPLRPADFIHALQGRSIRAFSRRAKYIVAQLDDGRHLLAHLRMTGQFLVGDAASRADPHDTLVIYFENGRRLYFHDTRKFGRIRLVDKPEDVLATLGPEPLSRSFTFTLFRTRLKRHQRMIKPLLLDQTFLAGIGNIYADETLWAARIHPQRQAHTLSTPEVRRLHTAIRSILTQAIAAQGTSLGGGATNFYSVAGRRGRHAEALQVFRRTHAPCPRCGTTIQRLTVAQRGTHVCPHCQTHPMRASPKRAAS